jgi:hypothetical protein
MATKTQNFYGVTLSSFSPLADRAEVQFSGEQGFIVTRRSKKHSPLLDADLHDAMEGQYPIDIIVDGRGSIVVVNKHDFNFDLSAHEDDLTYSVWIFSKSGAQILHTDGLTFAKAKELKAGLDSDNLDGIFKSAANFQHLGELTFRVVRSYTTYHVLDV